MLREKKEQCSSGERKQKAAEAESSNEDSDALSEKKKIKI